MKPKTIVYLFVLLKVGVARAQMPAADSGISTATEFYKQFIGTEAEIYKGPVSGSFNYTLTKGNRFFLPIQTKQGKVLYNGLMFHNIPLLYDVLHNKLITTRPSDNQSFDILNQHVSYFELEGHRFTHLQNPPVKNMPAGFYEIHFEGQKCSVYELHSKLLNEDLGEQFKRYLIEDNQVIYLKKDMAYFRVDKKKDLFRIFETKQAEIKSFIKTNNLKLAKINAATMAKIAEYFETL